LQQVTKNLHEGKDTPVFEGMDRLFERPLIKAAAAMDLEMPLLRQTGPAEVTPSISGGFGKTAAGAVRGEN
jgi:hypothetical protein